MRKAMLIIFAAICMGAVLSCSEDNDPEDVRSRMEDVRGGDSRSAAQNDSTEKGGITLNTEWVPDTTVNF